MLILALKARKDEGKYVYLLLTINTISLWQQLNPTALCLAPADVWAV